MLVHVHNICSAVARVSAKAMGVEYVRSHHYEADPISGGPVISKFLRNDARAASERIKLATASGIVV